MVYNDPLRPLEDRGSGGQVFFTAEDTEVTESLGRLAPRLAQEQNKSLGRPVRSQWRHTESICEICERAQRACAICVCFWKSGRSRTSGSRVYRCVVQKPTLISLIAQSDSVTERALSGRLSLIRFYRC